MTLALEQEDGRIRGGLYAVTLAALVCLLGGVLVYAWSGLRHAEHEAELVTRNLSDLLASRIASDLARTDGILTHIAQEVHADGHLKGLNATVLQDGAPGPVVVAPELQGLAEGFTAVTGLYIFDRQGWLRLASRPTPAFSVADRDHFQTLRVTPGLRGGFSPVQIARSTGRWSLVQMRAIRSDTGEFLGLVSAVLDLDAFARQFAAIDVGDDGVVALRRSDDFSLVQRVPAMPPDALHRAWPIDHGIRQRIEAGADAGSLRIRSGADGEERLGSFRVLDGYPFVAVVALSPQRYLADWIRQVAIVSTITVLLTGGLGLVLVWLARSERAARKANAALLHRQALFATLFEQSGFLAGVLDRFGVVQDANELALSIIGKSRDQVVGQYFPETPWWRPEDRPRLEHCLRLAAQGGRDSFEVTHPAADGTAVSVLFHAIPIQGDADGAIAVIGVDMTALKEAQAAQAASDERFRLAQEATAVGLWDWDLTENAFTLDPSCQSLLGLSGVDGPVDVTVIAGQICPEDAPVLLEAVRRAVDSGGRFAAMVRVRGGQEGLHWVQIRGRVVRSSEEGEPLRMIGTLTDQQALMQERERADAEAARLHAIALHVEGVVFQFQRWPDGRSRTPYASPGILAVYGLTPDEVRNDAQPVFERMHPDDLPAVLAAIEVSARELTLWRSQHRVLHPDGMLRWVEGSATPEARPDGSVLWHGYIQDITARKEAEEANAHLLGQLADSNIDLEQFAYVASHDLRQPLRMVVSYLQLMERRLDPVLDEDSRVWMGFASDGARRMDQMLQSLLEYSRVGRAGEPMEWMDARSAVEEALRFLDTSVGEASARVTVDGVWPSVRASRNELTRLFQNLIGNALKYRDPDHAPTVRILVEPVREGDVAWLFSVCDDGIGIAPEHLGRLFKVFQRLHGPHEYEGTGIGLAVARKIVERHGGRIWVESAGVGQGSCFRFTMPDQTSGQGPVSGVRGAGE